VSRCKPYCSLELDHDGPCGSAHSERRYTRAEVEALRVENARLREALKRIANGYEDSLGTCYWSGLDARDIARAALAGEEGTP